MEDKTWFFFKFGSEHHQGPFHENDIAAMYQNGMISKNDVFWRTGMPRWKPLKSLPEFSHLLPSEETLPSEPPPVPKIPEEIPPPEEIATKEEDISLVENIPKIPEAEPEPGPPIIYPVEVLWGGFFALLATAAFLIYFGLPENKTVSPYGITSLERQHLARLVGLTPSSSPRFHLVAEKSGESIWASTDYPRPGVVFLELKSYPQKALSTQKQVISSKAQLHGGYARFTEFHIQKGNWPVPGEYAAKISLYPLDSSSNPKNTTWQGTLTFAPRGNERLSKDLKSWKKHMQTSYIGPLEDQFQRYQTFRSQLNKTDELYQRSHKNNEPNVVFEKRYNREVGVLLHRLILDAQKQHLSLLNTNKQASLKYKKIVEYGNDIGQLALRMIEQLGKGPGGKNISRQVAKLRKKADLALEAITIRLKDYTE